MSAPDVDPLPRLAHRCWRALETLHVVVYFAPEPAQAYADLGLRRRDGYFASRSAALGEASPELVTATFYVFAPSLVARSLPQAWSTAQPAEVLAARHRGVRASLGPLTDGVDLDEVLPLVRRACEGLSVHGRALFAAHAALPLPDDPVLGLWHAATLLREHRGDGHVAALLSAGLGPVEAMVLHGTATGTLPFLRRSRGWAEEDWAAATTSLQAQGLLGDDGTLTAEGTRRRAEVEQATSRAAEEGWRHLGPQGCARLDELLQPLSAAVLSSGLLPEGLGR